MSGRNVEWLAAEPMIVSDTDGNLILFAGSGR